VKSSFRRNSVLQIIVQDQGLFSSNYLQWKWIKNIFRGWLLQFWRITHSSL